MRAIKNNLSYIKTVTLCRQFTHSILLYSNGFYGSLIFYFLNATKKSDAGGVKKEQHWNIVTKFCRAAQSVCQSGKVPKCLFPQCSSLEMHVLENFVQNVHEYFREKPFSPSDCPGARDAK